MRIIGNLLWWLFGGLEAAIGYFTGSLALACTIIGIPFAIQTFKIGLLCLWPFGSTVRESNSPTGCIRIPLNLLWLIFGGLWACLMHLFFGFLLCITIIGIPWGKQHFITFQPGSSGNLLLRETVCCLCWKKTAAAKSTVQFVKANVVG